MNPSRKGKESQKTAYSTPIKASRMAVPIPLTRFTAVLMMM